MKKLLLAIISLLIVTDFRAEISVLELKGATTTMQEPYKILSPARAALYWYSPFIRNIYSYGPDCATKSLIKKLFSILHDGVTFDCTHGYFQIARYLAPRHMGVILGIVQKGSNLIKEKKELEDDQKILEEKESPKLQDLLNRRKINITEITPKTVNQMLRRNKMKISLKDKEIKEIFDELTSYIQNSYTINKVKEMFEAIFINIGSIVDDQEKGIREKDANFEANKTFLATFKPMQQKEQLDDKDKIFILNHIFHIQDLAKILIQSKQEEGYLFPENTITNILLAFTWKKATDSRDFMGFYEGYAEQTNTSTHSITNLEEIWQTYTRDDYDKITLKDKLTFDELVFARLGFDIFENMLPQEVTMIGNAKIKNKSFPDCGETSLRNFFNLMLYTPEKTFDVSILEPLAADPNLIKFYQTYNTCNAINTDKSHHDWAAVVSGKEGVQYVNSTDKYEISDVHGMANMQKLIGTLIKGADTWQKLKDILKERCNINFNFEELEETSDEKILEFSITKNNDYKTGDLAWHFMKGHFDLSFSRTNTFTKYITIVQDQYANSADKYALLGLFADKKDTFEFEQNIDFLRSVILALSYPLENSKNKLNLLEAISAHKDDPTIQKIIKAIFLSLPDDFFSISEAMISLKLRKSEQLYTFIDKVLGWEEAQSSLCKFFVRKLFIEGSTNEQLHKKALAIVEKINDEKSISETISALIRREVKNDEEIKLLQPFFNWAAQNIQKIADDKSIAEITSTLISKEVKNDKEIELLQPFFNWAAQNTQKITDNKSMAQSTLYLIRKDIKNDKEIELLQPFFNWAAQNIQKITDNKSMAEITLALINKVIKNDKEIELLRSLFAAIAQNIQKITDNKSITEITSYLIIKDIKNDKEIELLQPLFAAAAQNIQKITNNESITQIISYYLMIREVKNDKEIELLQPLFTAAAQNVQKITDNESIIKITFALIGKEIKNDKEIALLQPLFTAAAQNIQKITDNESIAAIAFALIIIKRDVTNDKEINLLQPLFTTVSQKIQKITGDVSMATTIANLIKREIKDTEKTDLLLPFFNWASPIILATTNKQLINSLIFSIYRKEITSKKEGEILRPFYQKMIKDLNFLSYGFVITVLKDKLRQIEAMQ